MASWLEIAYGESVRALAEQRAALDGARSRAGGLIAAAGAVTGFMVSAALQGHRGWPATASLALVAFVVTVGVAVAANWTRSIRGFLSGSTLVDDPSWQSGDESDRLRDLVKTMSGHADQNEITVTRVHRLISIGYASLGAMVLLWTITLYTGR